VLELLRRAPDVEAPNLYAVDAADRLLLDSVAVEGRDVVVLGDHYGALTLGALERGAARVRVHTDRLTSERALQTNAERVGLDAFTLHGLSEELLLDAGLVLLALPRSLSALDELAAAVARHASADVVLHAAGRVKHMTVAQNDVLRRHFGDVRAGLGVQKCPVCSRPPVPSLRTTATPSDSSTPTSASPSARTARPSAARPWTSAPGSCSSSCRA